MKPYYEGESLTLYHGDCREVLPSLGSVDLVLTDPPYAASGAKKEWQVTASVAVGLSLAAQNVKKAGAMFVFSTSSGRGMLFTLEAIGPALRFNRLLVWHKEFVRSRVAGPWRWDLVTILAFGRASFGRPQYSSCYRTTGPASSNHIGSGKHPAELPDGIAEWLYRPFAEEVKTVLDPFCGTGQLLIPAVKDEKHVVGIELEEQYCEMAAERAEHYQRELPLGSVR